MNILDKIALETKLAPEQILLRIEISENDIISDIISLSNSEGGILVIGTDKENISGLEIENIPEISLQISDWCKQKITPPVFSVNKVMEIEAKKLLTIHVQAGSNPPYCDIKGTFWIRSGFSKRFLQTPSDFRTFFQRSQRRPDLDTLPETKLDDINTQTTELFIKENYHLTSFEIGQPIAKLLENIQAMSNQKLTKAGAMFFAKYPEKLLPDFKIVGIEYLGYKHEESQIKDIENITGTLPEQFQMGMIFLVRKLLLLKKQNKNKLLVIQQDALQELLVNALIHRDYTLDLPIKILIFDDRVEIISPGALNDEMTIDLLENRNIYHRNPAMVSLATKSMPVRGTGVGIAKALDSYPQIVFIDDKVKNQFKAIVYKPEVDVPARKFRVKI